MQYFYMLKKSMDILHNMISLLIGSASRPAEQEMILREKNISYLKK
jgi:hypothetical protein